MTPTNGRRVWGSQLAVSRRRLVVGRSDFGRRDMNDGGQSICCLGDVPKGSVPLRDEYKAPIINRERQKANRQPLSRRPS